MDRIEKMWNWIKHYVGDSQAAKAIFTFYVGVVAIGVIYGSCKGFGSWAQWRRHRRSIKIKNQMLQPIVNNTVDAGRLGGSILMSGLLSGFVVATAPVSVPLIVLALKEPEDKGGKIDPKPQTQELVQ